MSLFNCTDEACAQRTDIAVYMDVTNVEGVTKEGNDPVYTNAGAAWTQFTESPNAQTKERKYINEKTARSNITSYKPSWAFEVLLMYKRPEIKQIYDIVKKRKTGASTIITFVVVDLFDKRSDGVYGARFVKGAVQVSNLDDDDDMIMKGTIYNQGDEVLGTFDTSKGIFVADESAEAASDKGTEESGS